MSNLQTPFRYDFVGSFLRPDKLKEARKSINYTQEKLASKLNTTHSVISAYESGKTTISTLFIIEIAKMTNKSLNWLLDKVQ